MSDAKKKILVLDDEPDVVVYLETLLRDNGYETISAGEGRTGMELAKKEKPDLITLDISMPEASGARFYKEIKGDPALSAIPIVIITAVTGSDGDPRAYEKFISGRKAVPAPEGFLPKPIVKEELIGMVGSILTKGAVQPRG
jgi:CheY-like chemotaxis protein